MTAQARREQCVEAAIRVMAREGLDSATTRRIAAQAGAPHGTFHYAFRDKNELLTEVVATVTRQTDLASFLVAATDGLVIQCEVSHDEQACRWQLEQVIRAGAQLAGVAP